MATRKSLRVRGLPPEIGLKSRTTVAPTDVSPEIKESLLEPVVDSEKSLDESTQSVTDIEEVIQLDLRDIINILSKEMPLEKSSVVGKFLRKNLIQNQQVSSIYSSYFFRKDIIKEYQTKIINRIPGDKISGHALSSYNLYNKDDLLNNTFYKPGRIGERYTEKSTKYTNESKMNIKKIIQFLSAQICMGIDSTYARNALDKAIDLTKNEDKYDILVASTRRIEDLTLSFEDRMSGIVAFIIVELGECKKYPAAYSINLICTDLNTAISGTGSILMGAFLYTILSHPPNPNPSVPITFPPGESFLKVTSKRLPNGLIINNATFTTNEPLIPLQHVAVLELAGAYINPGGLCMYEKYGFTYDQTMFSTNPKAKPAVDCFSDRDNLPMLIDFETKPGYTGLSQEEKKEKILNIAANLDRGFPKSIICNIRDARRQKLLGFLKSIKLYIDNQAGATLGDFFPSTTEGAIINELKIIHAPQMPSNVSRRNAPKPSRPGTLDEFINYIENTPTPPDTDMEQKITKLTTILPKNIKGGRLSRKNKHVSNRYSRKMN
jgi:hypothetical protein